MCIYFAGESVAHFSAGTLLHVLGVNSACDLIGLVCIVIGCVLLLLQSLDDKEQREVAIIIQQQDELSAMLGEERDAPRGSETEFRHSRNWSIITHLKILKLANNSQICNIHRAMLKNGKKEPKRKKKKTLIFYFKRWFWRCWKGIKILFKKRSENSFFSLFFFLAFLLSQESRDIFSRHFLLLLIQLRYYILFRARVELIRLLIFQQRVALHFDALVSLHRFDSRRSSLIR